MNLDLLPQLLLAGVVIGSIYALAALGFVLIYKSSRVINFAHGQVIATGAFIAFALTQSGMNFWLAGLLAMLATFALGMLIERVFLRRMVGEPIISVIMVTIGLASVVDGLLHLTPYGAGNFSFTTPAALSGAGIDLLGTQLSRVQLAGVLAALALLGGFTYFFNRSTMGITMRAVADDQMAAMSVGTSVERVFALAWAFAGLTAAAAGVILGLMSGLTLTGLAGIGLKVFPVVILGGLDSVLGAIVGGILIGVLENLAAGYLDGLVPGGGTRDVFPFIVLLIVLLLRPYGLFGTKEIERV
ncbi:inner-membrane translocator [Deinococcus grandis]|uniref:Inner-membrane translocator n=1 Tax=Deinococcus grandis TaxID=57498 RepID=A0A117DQU2_9DEIO|nr:branched-chain amino acid ABC transporter permease [Deinococcus grandis]BBN94453.1 branched-chain amino acid ABC transporter permease [Deinococcus grandis]GAQ22049.1 inner-membrane translocator [Deinococcus grandis]